MSAAPRHVTAMAWWVLGIATAALAASFVSDSALLLQLIALVVAVVALFRVRGARNAVIIAAVAVILGIVVALQIVAVLQALGLDRYFTQDAALVL